MNRIFYALFFSLILLYSCKGTKAVTGGTVKKLKAEKVIANHYNKAFNFTSLNAKVKVKYQDAKQSFSPNVTLRIEKDKKIWVSAKLLGITLAKALITPEKVSYYEKVNGTYFEGDFKLLSEWLGTNLDFDKVQQLLLGQSIFNLRDDKYTSEVQEGKYVLRPKKQLELFERLFLIHPDSFKMAVQQLKQEKEKRNLAILYKSYQKVGNQYFPKEINIEASEDTDRTLITIDYRTVDYNAKVSFPFKIPSGYEQVTIE
ncbi:hypothetical protein AB832_06680 [Flavobacteriaceae bacterium (ex Bugula neritina AB1)]|nr:hypothetical protein AB832_06680 [Flavobacteriaceae bacterium (ex Bugula neritina AB1)]